jgi:hypothetical protein
VSSAANEIRSGRSVSLNWGLEKLHEPGFGRTPLNHRYVNWREKENYPFYSWDDEIVINTQTGMSINIILEFEVMLIWGCGWEVSN